MNKKCDHIVGKTSPRRGSGKELKESEMKKKGCRLNVYFHCPICGKLLWEQIEKKDKIGTYKIKQYVGDK